MLLEILIDIMIENSALRHSLGVKKHQIRGDWLCPINNNTCDTKRQSKSNIT